MNHATRIDDAVFQQIKIAPGCVGIADRKGGGMV
jgi:hypothetical protein